MHGRGEKHQFGNIQCFVTPRKWPALVSKGRRMLPVRGVCAGTTEST